MIQRKVHTVEGLKERCIEEGDCWIWQGYFANGTPQVRSDGKMTSVRKVLLELQGRAIVKTKAFAPSCGCSQCVNPDHVTQLTKSQQMARIAKKVDSKGPGRRLKLTAHARATKAKITIEIAREIRISDESGPVLSEKYGVTRGVINRVRRNESWADNTNPFWRLAA